MPIKRRHPVQVDMSEKTLGIYYIEIEIEIEI